MLNRSFSLLAIAALLPRLALADDVPRAPVENFKVLLVAAIDSPSGESHGVLVGPIAQALSTRMKAAGPVLIDVATAVRYRQPGCSRLKILFSQEGVVLPGTADPRRQTFELGLNYCRDGTPPKSLL